MSSEKQTTLGVAEESSDKDSETPDGACVHCGNVVPGRGQIVGRVSTLFEPPTASNRR